MQWGQDSACHSIMDRYNSVMKNSDLNADALRRIEAIVFDCTIAYDRRLVMIQDILYQLQAMQDARCETDA